MVGTSIGPDPVTKLSTKPETYVEGLKHLYFCTEYVLLVYHRHTFIVFFLPKKIIGFFTFIYIYKKIPTYIYFKNISQYIFIFMVKLLFSSCCGMTCHNIFTYKSFYVTMTYNNNTSLSSFKAHKLISQEAICGNQIL